MDIESPFQPQLGLAILVEELPGILEVPDRPEITAGYADIYHGVWRGQDGTQVDVAIKEFKQLVPKDKRTDLDALKRRTDRRLKREVAVWGRLSHPNLHPLLGYRSQPRPRLISPWCRHGNLQDYLRDNPCLSRSQKLRLVYQAACGLHHLHTQTPPICHADIKPQNVLINELLEAALSDFGLSRALQELSGPSEFTTSETVKGTLNYMAGELFAGSKPNLQTDVYAFGGLVLTVMSGKAPFFGLHQATIIFRVMQDQSPRPEDHPDLPSFDPLWELMRGCWDKSAAARPTMQEIMGKLLGYVGSEQSDPWLPTGLQPVLDDGSSKESDMDVDTPGATPKGGSLPLPPLRPVLADDQTHTLGAGRAGNSFAEVALAARMIFKDLEVHSKIIPGIGGYIAAAVEVGITLLEMVKPGSNDSSSAAAPPASSRRVDDKDKYGFSGLLSNVWELAVLLELLRKKSTSPQESEIAVCIMNIQRELRSVREKVEQQRSSGSFQNAFSSCDNKEASKRPGVVGKLLEEIQLLVTVNAADRITVLVNPDTRDQERRLLELLGDGKYGAQGNSIEDVTCFPGTRVEILKRIDNWIRDASTPDRVLWIRGMAGRGKSTIVSTVVHNWKYRASCATFHFRRGKSTLGTSIVCILARQLGNSLVADVRNAILKSVQEKEDIVHQRFDEQFKTLLVASLAHFSNQTHPVLIAVDALDECDNPQDATALVKLIDEHSSSLPTNVKFLLTCRPEAPLLHILEPRKWHVEDLDSASDVSDDIARFVKQTCIQIRDDYDLPAHWPSDEDVTRLVEMSEGLFQWARTAITYISNGSPVDRLRGLVHRPFMWSGLDDLYHQILLRAFDRVKLDTARQELLCSVIGTLVVASSPVSLEVIAVLYGNSEVFEGVDHANIVRFLHKDILADLNSLLLIPASPAEPMRLMHTSISDLLVSNQRCERRPYYIDTIRFHQQLARLSLTIMLTHLKENICNLDDLSKSNSEVQNVAEREVTQAVRYCCQAWSIHLTTGAKWLEPSTDATTLVLADFGLFSKERLMYWLEVMSLVGATREAIIMAKSVYQWLLQCPWDLSELKPLVTLWNDVRRFITTFQEPISFGPLHIYASALPHCPIETELWKCYHSRAAVRIVRGLQVSTWPSNIWARSTGSSVNTATFSPDGVLIALGSHTGQIQLWDTETGTLCGEPLTGHQDRVNCVCFSPDGKVLASGSGDTTIRLWNTRSWIAVDDPLVGHSDAVLCVCFSPDGRILASGSRDETIRFWDVQTGKAVGEPLTGHGYWVRSVCFSRGGEFLASGSGDGTIRLWDTQNRTPVGEPLVGHSDYIFSVCFSPDGKVMASGSADGTIRLWDPQTRLEVGGPLPGHSDWIYSVCFSPDGKLLASGSGDTTIRIWDARTGRVVGEPLRGHNSLVLSVCFSPDGKVLASGSGDGTIRLWDTQAGGMTAPTFDNASLQTICFSPDGKKLASGNSDGMVQLWDSQKGSVVAEFQAYSRSVHFVGFSPDGKAVISCFGDGTAQLWDTQTGMAIGEPFSPQNAGWVRKVGFSPDGRMLAFGSSGYVTVWDTQTKAIVGTLYSGYSFAVSSVCFSPDGKVLACGYAGGIIQLCDVQTVPIAGKILAIYHRTVQNVSFSSDGMVFMADYYDGSSACWHALTLQRCDPPHNLPWHTNLKIVGGWVKYSSYRLFWLPPQYWGKIDEISICDGLLCILSAGSLTIFDLSRALNLWFN